MTVQFGVNPIGWSNDDMLELGADISLETCLGEARGAGYTGIELGNKFPRTASALAPILAAHDINLVGGWYSTELQARSAAAEIAAMADHLALIKDMGCQVFIMAETHGAIHGDRTAPVSQKPVIADGDWKTFTDRMTEVCAYVRDQGLTPAYHHHMGTVVQTAAEIDRFMSETGDGVQLLLDAGHATFAGADPVALARAYVDRISHVHCKDIRLSVRDRILAEDQSFLNAVVEGVFTVPGDGDIDFPALLEVFGQKGYDGWLVVEAEQDPKKADPKTYAYLGYTNLSKLAQDAGLS